MSMAWVPLLVFAGIVLVAIVGIFIERQRTERLQTFARSRGLAYEKRNDSWARVDLGWPSGFGKSHRAKHVMTGEHNGRPLVVFEHIWVTGSGDNRQTHYAMVCALQLRRSFPKLTVGREGVFSSIARKIGVKDIELESDDFNREYKVKCDDRKFAYDVLHPRFMQWMLSTQADMFTISGQYLARASSMRLKEEYVDQQIAYLDAIVDRIPSFVFDR